MADITKSAGWDDGAYNRKGFGLGQYDRPWTEDKIAPADKVRQGKKTTLDYAKIVNAPRNHKDQTK